MELKTRSFLAIFFFMSLSLSHQASMAVDANDNKNPFTARAALNRYWNAHISNNLPIPAFFFSKASPLNALDLALYSNLHTLPHSRIPSFCSSANLFCQLNDVIDDVTASGSRSHDSNFIFYSNKHFINYGSAKLGGSDTFKNYSDGFNLPTDSFARYSKDATGHVGSFTSYARDANVANATFASYGGGATGGSGQFDSYDTLVNVPHLHFASYDQNANSHKLSFTSYTAETNSGDESFSSYGREGNGAPAEFKGYADEGNTITSTFIGYGETGNGANDTFKGYGTNGNNPRNNFKIYGPGGNAGIDSFSSYRDGANVGDDTFESYAKNSNSAKVNFGNYGKTFNEGTDLFKEYGKGSKNEAVGFKQYGLNTTFKEYEDRKTRLTFAGYTTRTENRAENRAKNRVVGGVEQGKFFRESNLKQGTVMMMPDIRDKMPQRSFLPKSIASKLPISTTELPNLKRIFHTTTLELEHIMTNSITECEREPSRGETKKCVGSAEEMIDFATSVLGDDVVVRSTENVKGSGRKVLVGKVVGINEGNVTKTVSCHQSLYPYLMYYCHSVPKVRVYEAELMEVEMTRVVINKGVAICHVDTSAWSRTHAAFVALGYGPGEIEVCHWIYENDMTWASADHV